MSLKRVRGIIDILERMYPGDIPCYLHHATDWQLLIATILSAQCTDERVNIVTKDLFVKYPTVESFAGADLTELEEDIRSTGFYHNKAKNIIECCKALRENHGGKVPSDIDELTKLAGVGRKTANVIRGHIYHIPSIVVDTHVKRISYRLQLTDEEDPVKVEFDLMKILPKEYWISYNTKIIAFGREICRSAHPKCQECPLAGYCRNS